MPAALAYRPDVLWRRIRAVFLLLRPFNFVMFLLGVGLGGVLVAGFSAFEGDRGERLLLAALSAALIGGSANSLNDVFDLRIDRINRPERPLPSGLASPGLARALWAGGSLAGVVLSLWISYVHVAMAILSVVLLYGYSARLKRTVLVGNSVVALMIALALVYGGWAVGSPGPALVGAGFAFLTTLAREIVKDVEDAVGDRGEGAQTLPVVYGLGVAAAAASAVVCLTILLLPLPYGLLGYGGVYLLLVFVAGVLLLRVLWLLQAPVPGATAARASRLLKGAMAVGMGALAFAGING